MHFEQIDHYFRGFGYIGLYVVIYCLATLLAMHALVRVRTSQGAIAWTLSLMFAPYVAIPAYLIFGWRRLRGYRRAMQQNRRDIRELIAPLKVQGAANDSNQHFLPSHRFLAQLPATRGNRARLLTEGEASFQLKCELISKAKQYILIQCYIFRADSSGTKLAELLMERARAGVQVYFLYDDIGSYQLPRRFVAAVREAGVQVHSFRSTRFRSNRFRINFRNHRKLLIVDGREAVMGGTNIGDEYRGLNLAFGAWRDSDILLAGPSVQCLQLAFIEDWLWVGDVIPVLHWQPQIQPENEAVLIAATGPADELEAGGLYFVDLINQATQRLWLATPYFVPDQAVLAALNLAVLRGVDVRLIVPQRLDHVVVQYASQIYLGQLADIGANIYRYQNGFMHQKTALVDDRYAYVGSANLDNRSFRLNFELMATLTASKTIAEVEAMFLADFGHSLLAERDEWANRGLVARLLSGFARLFAPIL